jgi:hypothetical protein
LGAPPHPQRQARAGLPAALLKHLIAMDKKLPLSTPPPSRRLCEEEWISSLAHTGRIVSNAEGRVNLDAAVEQRRREDAKAEYKAMHAFSSKSKTHT